MEAFKKDRDIVITAEGLKKAMARFGHTQNEAAEVIGIGRRTLIRKLQDEGILEFRVRSIGRSMQLYINDSITYEKRKTR
jgi:hypothetical protein